MPSSPDSPSSAPIDLTLVRRLFADPERVASSAFLRREVASRMQERLELVRLRPQVILDAGCGDGADLQQLRSTYSAMTVGVDASLGMLKQARRDHGAAQSVFNRLMASWFRRDAGKAIGSSTLLCGDFAQLPLLPSSVDLVWSNLALHWHPRPPQVFADWRRVLRVDGLLMFSCFGPDSFRELKTAFAKADGFDHVLPFVDMHDLGDMLVEAGFSTPVMDMETVTVTYGSIEKLLADARAFGGNPLASRRRGLLGRRSWQRVGDALNAMRRPDGKLPLTFEIVYGHAFRPAPRRTSAGESIVRFEPKKR